jgi:hypothetical protein
MKKVTKNKLKMYNQVIAVCTLHQSSWGFVPTFESQFDVFKNDHTALLARLDLHGAQLSGHTRNKREAQQVVVGKAYTFMNALSLHAELSGDFVLLARNNSSQSSLREGGMEAMIARLNTLKQDAEMHIDALGAMGLTTTDLDDLIAAIAAFQASVTEPRQAIIRRKQLTREIYEIQQRLDDQLKDKIDRLMVLMKKFDPDFNRLYKDARVILDYKNRSNRVNIEPPDDESQ